MDPSSRGPASRGPTPASTRSSPGGSVPFPAMNVFFVSREPVRAPQPVAEFAAVARGVDNALPGQTVPGSLSASFQGRFVVAACPKGIGRASESAMAEVYEYDPVRYQSLVIGLVEPPAETPVHWICRRVNPEARLVAVIHDPPELAGEIPSSSAPRGYLGNPDTLLQVGRLLRGSRAHHIEGMGLVVWGRSSEEFLSVIKAPAK